MRSDDTIDCWGKLDGFKGVWGQIPNGRFKSVDTGAHRTCGIRRDDSISWWWHKGYDYASHGFSPPPGSFKRVAVSDSWVEPLRCALKFDGTLICWRDGLPWLDGIPPQAFSEAGSFKSLSDHRGTICGIGADHTVECWGRNFDGENPPPAGEFLSVAMGYRHACGIGIDNTVSCWGYGKDGQTASPNGRFTVVAAGASHACGIRTDASIECWGDDADGKTEAPSGSFSAISAGPSYTCAIEDDGAVVCWGKRRQAF